MKKFIAIVLVTLTVLSFSTAAFAADTTTLTTTVPDATYTLNIPADQEITFGATSTNIGTITVTDSSGFALNKNLQVTVTYDDFKADGVSTTIPYYINSYAFKKKDIYMQADYHFNKRKDSGSFFTFKGISGSSGKCSEYYELEDTSMNVPDDSKVLQVKIDSADWGKALGGEYSSTITFTAEVVVES